MWIKRRTHNSFNEEKIENSRQVHDYIYLKKILSKNADIKFQQILINNDENLSAMLVYVIGMVDFSYISDYILKPLVQEECFKKAINIENVICLIENGGVYFASRKKSADMDEVINDILSGQTALLFEQCQTAIIFDVKGFEKRAITETSSENVTKGVKDSFVETLNTNTALVRRKIRSKNLIVEKTTVGKQTLTTIAVLYIEGIANDSIVNGIKEKLESLDIDGVLSTGFIEESIIENSSSAFPQMMYTERTDKFCADLMEGQVGIIIDGFPIAFILPPLFVQFLQTPEDYAFNYIVGSMVRCMRFLLMLLTLFLPGFYISVTSFNPEMIPTSLAFAIAEYRTGVTFPTFIETILMLIAFEILLEAGFRMPKNIGQAVSIVGALIVGEAAVNAKLVSPSVVIVVALTAISSFAMPNMGFSNALRIWRLIITMVSSIFGLVGLTFSFIALLFTLVKIENFGVPYMAPLVSTDGEHMDDTFFRLPLKPSKKRKITKNIMENDR